MNDVILAEADRIINGDRQRDYGDRQQSFDAIASLWSAYLGVSVAATDVAHLMILLKISRATTGGNTGKRDSYVDMAGYAALAYGLDDEEARA